MRVLINSLLTLLLAISSGTVFGVQLLNASASQQNQEQNASPQQQTPPPDQQRSRSAVVQSVTGCVVKSDNGYSLKTESDSYPLETDQDLSQYVNKQVRVTGMLEHQHTPASSTGDNATTITDIRLRMVASVIGDCHQPSK
jgi:hypothetical protein